MGSEESGGGEIDWRKQIDSPRPYGTYAVGRALYNRASSRRNGVASSGGVVFAAAAAGAYSTLSPAHPHHRHRHRANRHRCVVYGSVVRRPVHCFRNSPSVRLSSARASLVSGTRTNARGVATTHHVRSSQYKRNRLRDDSPIPYLHSACTHIRRTRRSSLLCVRRRLVSYQFPSRCLYAPWYVCTGKDFIAICVYSMAVFTHTGLRASYVAVVASVKNTRFCRPSSRSWPTRTHSPNAQKSISER